MPAFRVPNGKKYASVTPGRYPVTAGASKTTSTTRPSSTPSDASTTEYVTWAVASGITFSKITQAYFGDLRGSKALSSIDANDTFVSVPRKAALVVEPKSRCPCPEFISPDFWKEAPWYTKMAVLLLHEESRGRDSPVWGYIEQLPPSIDTPVRWEDHEIAELQYPTIEAAIKEQRSQWRSQYDKFQGAAKGLRGADVSWERFVWALENVRSRAFSGPYSGAPLPDRLRLAGVLAAAGVVSIAWAHVPLEQTLNGAIAAAAFNLLYDVILSSRLRWYALCPIIDSINHSSRVSSKIEYEYFRDTFVASTAKPWAAGEQVFISYGAQSNDSLFQYYGFVEANNPQDVYVADVMLENNVGSKEVRVVVTSKGSLAAESLATVREVLDVTDEKVVQRALADVLQGELERKPTTLTDDERMLAAPHLTTLRLRAALEFRAEKKRLLRRGIQQARKKASKLERG